MKRTGKQILSVALALMLALALCVPALAEETTPDDGLATRGDVVKWLYSDFGSAFRAEKTDAVFTDIVPEDGVEEAAAWAAALGIVKGYGDGRFGPNDLVTREQAATMLYRFAQVTGQGFRGAWMFLLNYADAEEISGWANEAMHWVVMKGILTGIEGNDPVERLAPQDFIGINELPVWIRRLEDALATVLESGGYTLAIPVNYARLLNTELPAAAPEGTLFSVAEQASIDAGKAKGYENYDGMGWLFAIQKISEAEVRAMLCADMSGREVFAKDDEGAYFLFCHPTDVRFDRETIEQMEADSDVWIALNEWGQAAKDNFINGNGLTPVHYGNSDFEIALYRVAYDPTVKYTLSTTAFGPLEPDPAVDAAAYVLRAMDGAAFEFVDLDEGPDGEYVVLNFPEEGTRYDVFTADGNLIRRVTEWGDDYTRVTYEDSSANLHDILEAWYFALASAHGLKPVNG